MSAIYLVFTDGDHYDFAVTWLGAFTSREAAERAARHESFDPSHTWEGDLAEYEKQLSYYKNRVPYYRNHFVEDALGLLDKVAAGLRPDDSLMDGVERLRGGRKNSDLRHGLLVDALAKALDIYDDVRLHYMGRRGLPAAWRDWPGSPEFVQSEAGMKSLRGILRAKASRILRDALAWRVPKAPSRLDYRTDPVDGRLHRRGRRHWVEEIALDKETAR